MLAKKNYTGKLSIFNKILVTSCNTVIKIINSLKQNYLNNANIFLNVKFSLALERV